MRYLIALLSLFISANGWAGTSALDVVTVSRTLTLTSPSAYISMTGVSATAYIRNVSATNVSASSKISVGSTDLTSASISKAWVLGGSLTGTWAVSASYNVSSISRITAGEYNVSFTTPFSSANYVTAATCDTPNVGANECQVMVKLNGRSAGGIRLLTRYNGGQNDVTGVNAVFFGYQ